MRSSRVFFLIGLLVVAAAGSWLYLSHQRSPIGDRITVYYTSTDGKTETPWSVSMRPQEKGESAAEHLHNAALYAATQAIAGPPSTIQAVRFPVGTHLRSIDVTGSTANLDLSNEVKAQTGTFDESGEFKELVWTLTALPGINAVGIRVDGQRLDTLPGGHLELDTPLHRSDW
ncbi:MAG: GerMN domain-containing protein [Candidatus Baltobacteraceae bacterium]